MEGTNAAATLSLEISTDRAAANLAALATQYGHLQKLFGEGLPTPDSTLAKFGQYEKQIASLKQQMDAMKTTYANLGQSAAGAGKEVAGLGKALRAVSNASLAQAGNDAATTKLLRERAEAATLAAAAETRLAQASAASVSAAQAGNNAATTKLLRERAEAATLAAAAEARLAQASAASVSAAQAGNNAATTKLLRERAEAATLAAAAEARLAQASAASIAAAQAGNNAATVKLLRERAEAATLAAAAETRLAEATKLNVSLAQAGNNAATAKLLRERAEAANLAAAAEDRLAQATRSNAAAAQAASAAATQRVLADRARGAATYDPLLNRTIPAFAPETAIPAAHVAQADVLATSHQRLAPAIKQTAASQIDWNHAAKEGHTVVRGLAGSLGSLWITYGQLAPLLAGAALGGAFIKAAKAGSEFAYELTFVKALSEETAASVELLSRSTLELSKASLQGPSEIASGYRVLAQAGLNVTDSITAMPQVLHLATVGEMEMEAAAITLVGVLNAFSLGIDSVEHVGDVFAKAAAVSQSSVLDLTQAMRTASVVGEQYGASMEDTATALTLLAKVNIKGTAAGTSFRNMLKELYAPVPQAAKALDRLGVSSQDAMGNIRPFADVIYDLKGKLEDFNKGDQIKILQKLFGERGAKEAIAMLALTREEWNKLKDAIGNSEGFMEGVAKELEDTAKGRWAKAVNTMKSTLIDAFHDMEPAFKDLADSFKDLFSDPHFTDNLKQVVGAMLSLTSVVVQMTPLLISLAEAWIILKAATISAGVWTAASGAVMGYAGALAAASGAMGPVLAGTTATRTALSLLPASFAALLSPMGLVVGGLAAAGAAFFLFRDHTGEAMEASANKVRGFARETSQLLKEISGNIDSIGGAAGRVKVDSARASVDTGDTLVEQMARQYAEKYQKGGKQGGQASAIEAARRYVEDIDNRNADGYALGQFVADGEQGRAARALVSSDRERTALRKKLESAEAAVAYAELGERNQGLVEAAAAKPKTSKRNVADILGSDRTGAGARTPRLPKDYDTPQETSKIDYFVQEQRREIALLESKHSNKLISEEKYQLDVAEIYKRHEGAIEGAYGESLSRLASLRESLLSKQDSDEFKRADKNFTDQLKSYDNFLAEKTLRTQSAADKEEGIIKASRESIAKIIAEQEANTAQIIENIEASRIKLDLTPVQSAGYDAKRASEKTFAKPIADAESRQKSLAAAGYEEESTAMKAVRAEIELLIEAKARLGAESAAAAEKEAEFAREYATGWKSAYKQYVDDATNAARLASDQFQTMSSHMTEAFDTFLETGKLNFADFAKSLILDMAKLEAEALKGKLLKSIGGEGGGGGFGGIVSGILGMLGMGGSSFGTSGTTNSFMTNGVALRSAKGNVFSGSPSLHQYANTVQSSPKTFGYQNLHGFAKGGVFAEAGPEAVMPLTRDQQGRLGVKAQGSSGDNISITVHVNGNSNAPDVRRAAGQGAREALNAFNGARRYA